jgi:glycosyltransferase involved in cell wall biosynthesis
MQTGDFYFGTFGENSSGTHNFACVGTIEPRKNHALLLDIWDAFAGDPEAPMLVIAGARGWRNEAVFERLDARPAGVIEAPGLSDGALAALVAGAEGLLFPTLAEGFGLPPVEALALGTPVICSDLPVLHEVLGKSSIYASVDDMYLWKQSILQIAGQVGAETASVSNRAVSIGEFKRPTWAAHFNLVLKVI